MTTEEMFRVLPAKLLRLPAVAPEVGRFLVRADDTARAVPDLRFVRPLADLANPWPPLLPARVTPGAKRLIAYCTICGVAVVDIAAHVAKGQHSARAEALPRLVGYGQASGIAPVLVPDMRR